ncbi:MAG: LysR family transcriptional regulator [Actinomycetota bacterium]
MDQQSSGISLDRLRVFVAVIEHGGFTAAARRLRVSQPTVSFHVRELERTFGASLLLPRGRGHGLTPAGELVQAFARRVLGDAASTQRRLTSLEQGKAGRVRLGASLAFEQAFFFDDVVAPFLDTHEQVELSIVFDTSPKIAEAVRERTVDLGYVMGAPAPPDLRYEHLHGSAVAFFVSSSHLLAAETAPSAAAVGGAGLITVPMDSAEWAYYAQVLRAARMSRYRVALEVSGMQARVQAARSGLGVLVTFWPPYAQRTELAGLRRLDLQGGPMQGPEFGLLRREDAPTDPPARALTSWLRDATRQQEIGTGGGG